MVELRKASARLLLGAVTLVLEAPALAQDMPVERPSVEHPAAPSPSQPEPVTRPETAHPAPASRASVHQASSTAGPRRSTGAPPRRSLGARARGKHPAFLYLGAGLGLLSGLGGGKDFERSNPALTGLVGVELPVGSATGLGFELSLDAELAGEADRGSYTAALLRARLAQMLTPSARLWGAVGVGRAGYETGTLAGAVAVGSSFLLAPKFGLDLSANLALLAASDDRYPSAGPSYVYDGGCVLLIAVKALFETHPSR